MQNNSDAPLCQVSVSSAANPIFAFDGDGICGADPNTGAPYNPAPAGCPFGPTTYEGPGVSFSGISGDQAAGAVTFSPCIAPGGSTYFSLEGAVRVTSTLTFSQVITTKMFIGIIGPNYVSGCDPGAIAQALVLMGVIVPGELLARVAAYMAFCGATDLIYHENPLTGAFGTPLDARVLAAVKLRWQCEPDSPLPVQLGEVTPLGVEGGPEPLGLTGIAHPIATANNILADGTWAFVSSGHPNPLAEPAFQVILPNEAPPQTDELYGGSREHRSGLRRSLG